MKVLISGSSGLIGTALVRSLESSDHSVTRLVRPNSARVSDSIAWDPASGSLDARRLEGFDAAIHLSGENVASGRWSADQKARIRDSRVRSAGLLANALAGLDSPPKVFACASATGYYGDRGDEILTEDAAPGSDFLASVGVEWEQATAPASEAGIRVANMRISVVLTAAGGMVATV
ncbi:MAG: NAD-dependent epimerase/dehydratase family protein, partial [Dehalococcoidia bacterium]|nr:NAD-dependent epimerase/dehydratase family protein [Dehalococcoidia bacterium]